VVTKEELLKEIWPDSFVEESNLSQNIFMLRKVLETLRRTADIL
jgi:DNA-binding winged helix-turn-helix (wHTH) protein